MLFKFDDENVTSEIFLALCFIASSTKNFDLNFDSEIKN